MYIDIFICNTCSLQGKHASKISISLKREKSTGIYRKVQVKKKVQVYILFHSNVAIFYSYVIIGDQSF